MEAEAECFVSGTLASALRLSRLVGLAPLFFHKHQNGWRITPAPLLVTYGYFIIFILYALAVVTIAIDYQYVSITQVSVVNKGIQIRFYWWVTHSVLLMIMVGVTLHGAKNLMMPIISYSNLVAKVNHEMDGSWPWLKDLNRKKKQLIMSWILTSTAMALLELLLLFTNADVDYFPPLYINVMYSFYWYSFLTVTVQQILIMIITSYICSTFKDINDAIRTLLQDGSLTSNGSCDKVRHLSSIYTSFCAVVRQLNHSFGFILVVFLMYILCNLVLSPFYLIKIISLENSILCTSTSCNYMFILARVCWCIHHAVNLVIVIEPCHLTHVEMNTTRDLVSHLNTPRSTHEPLSIELELFHRHLVLNQAAYSPLGVVTLSRSLVLAIFASTITYLVVFLQLYAG